MTIRSRILTHAQLYCRQEGLSARAFCLAADVDKRVLHKLNRGENVSLATLEKIEAYLAGLVHEGKLAPPAAPVMGKAKGNVPSDEVDILGVAV